MKISAYNDFSKGFNDTVTPFNLAKNEVRKAINVSLDEQGGFATRKGNIIYNSLPSISTDIVQYIEWVRGNETKELVYTTEKKLYEIVAGAYVLKTTLNSDRFNYIILKSGMYFSDGLELYEWLTGSEVINPVIPNAGAGNDLAPIKKCTTFIFHYDSFRIFACGNPDDPTALYYSELNDISYFKQTSIMYPIYAEGEITGLCILSGALLVSYNNSWAYWGGSDPETDAVWKPLNIPYGCISQESIVLTPYSITFLAREGIIRVMTNILGQSVTMVQSDSIIKILSNDKVENTIKSIKNLTHTQAIFYDNKYFLAYNDTTNTQLNNKVLVYNWDLKCFPSVFDGWDVYSFVKKSTGELLLSSKNYILQAYEGDSDINTTTGVEKAIVFEVITKHETFGNFFSNKFIKFLLIALQQGKTENSSVTIGLLGDYLNEEMTLSDSEAMSWGAVWGSQWGYAETITRVAEINKRAIGYQVRVYNDKLNDPVNVQAIGFVYENMQIKPNLQYREEDLLK